MTSSSDWLYFGLCTGPEAAALERLVVDRLRPIATCGGVDRWFFLRYADYRGPHVRLRLRAAGREVSALRGELEPACRSAVEAVGGAGVFVDEYVPELDKFGGAGGVDAAEELFEVSSEVAIDALRAGHPRRETALALMAAVLDGFPPRGGAAAFWRGYAGRLGGAPAAAGTTAPEARADPALCDRWRRAIVRCAGRFDELDGAPPVEALAANFVHLMNNRLGCTLAGEARLAAILAERTAA